MIGCHQGATTSAAPEANTTLGHQETPGSGGVLCGAGDPEVCLITSFSCPGLPARQPWPNRDKGGPYFEFCPSSSSLLTRLPDLKTV